MSEELLAIADEIYALTLAEFTPARDARAKALKGSDLAKAVKTLKKPSLAAWIVNVLVRRDPDQVDQVLTVGAALREAAAAMSGEQLRALTRQRRQVTAAVTQQARSLATESGVKVTQAVTDQVEATLTAAMLDQRCAQAVRSGLLVTAITTTGVDEVDLGGAVALPAALGFEASPVASPDPDSDSDPDAPAAGTRPDLHVVPDPEAEVKALAAAQEALDEAEEQVKGARQAYEETVSSQTELEARSMQLQAEIDELKRRLADREESADEVDDALGDAEDARTEAYAELEEATATRDAAAAEVERRTT
ncbi:hypothetical protein NPS01_07450 [Nocardioides psychrotolerans]|uniref:Uncharacterized protein n=1 Tax=Nocardioides psychrotolerans TaxID=1005945 RepID=A0A1I3D8C5_9ACTN|nr:hypothetical protein [Nocardioides psychrotolerans]GEP37082.1 hypothetical protein NPS01_07450 [Nocardioides psychrotolerans]SFH82962.1 hypothetical protein SAMN05216561_102396 [Nocardioides psychrotolerans]